jgi:hypothetical protein
MVQAKVATAQITEKASFVSAYLLCTPPRFGDSDWECRFTFYPPGRGTVGVIVRGSFYCRTETSQSTMGAHRERAMAILLLMPRFLNVVFTALAI